MYMYYIALANVLWPTGTESYRQSPTVLLFGRWNRNAEFLFNLLLYRQNVLTGHVSSSRFPDRHIMSVTGHMAESSLKTYTGYTDSKTKQKMSETEMQSFCSIYFYTDKTFSQDMFRHLKWKKIKTHLQKYASSN
jgi:hypothetical protein